MECGFSWENIWKDNISTEICKEHGLQRNHNRGIPDYASW